MRLEQASSGLFPWKQDDNDDDDDDGGGGGGGGGGGDVNICSIVFYDIRSEK
jgi:hypothetical protein